MRFRKQNVIVHNIAGGDGLPRQESLSTSSQVGFVIRFNALIDRSRSFDRVVFSPRTCRQKTRDEVLVGQASCCHSAERMNALAQ